MRRPLLYSLYACLILLCAFALTGDAADHLRVTVTAYSSGTITASGLRVRPGHIALSRDVERSLGVTFGDMIQVDTIGVFRFEDRMPFYWSKRIDLYVPSKSRARQFGLKRGVLIRRVAASTF